MSWSGLENTFRKSDADDIIVQTFRWDDVVGKPTDIDEKIEQIAELARLALLWPAEGETRYLVAADTLRTVRRLLNDILLTPLETAHEHSEPAVSANHKIFIERDWATQVTDKPEGLDTMLETIAALNEATKDADWLSKKTTLMDVKTTINECLLRPIRELYQDESE